LSLLIKKKCCFNELFFVFMVGSGFGNEKGGQYGKNVCCKAAADHKHEEKAH